MERLRELIVPILALILVGVAALAARWVSQTDLDPRMASLSGSRRFEGYDGPVTYGFLPLAKHGAVAGRLTLGRFAGSQLQEGATWEFSGVDQWHGWAPAIFHRETGWVIEEKPGYRISRWLCAAESGDCDCDHLFWSLQALRFLDPESLARRIEMIENSGQTIRVCLTRGVSEYDYDSDTLRWNPVATRHLPVEEHLDRRWFKTDPLIVLGHELNHAWHDVCCAGDSADAEAREWMAVSGENRLRHMLFLKDSTRSDIYPRPGCWEACPDILGDSAQEAWQNYTGRVRFNDF